MAEMVTIPKKEYERLKALDIDEDFIDQVREGLEDVKNGRVVEY